MLHTVLRRRANGETVEDIQPDLLIPTGRRKGQSPSLSSIYRALAEHEKTQAYPEAIKTAHADFAALQQRDRSPTAAFAVGMTCELRRPEHQGPAPPPGTSRVGHSHRVGPSATGSGGWLCGRSLRSSRGGRVRVRAFRVVLQASHGIVQSR